MLDLLMRGLSDLTIDTDGAAATATEQHEDYNAIATLLGRRLGEMHQVLARPSDDPAFAPERATADTVQQWIVHAEEQIASAFAALGRQTEWPPASSDDLAAVWLSRRWLEDTLQYHAAAAQGSVLTRIHGNLHLGQTLVANGDVYIITVRGRTHAAHGDATREAPSVARCRQHDALARLRGGGGAAQESWRATRICLTRAAMHFCVSFLDRATQSFLAGYREVIPPEDPVVEQRLLDFFLIEKAAYEIAYEAANRPTWIDVPLQGLARLIGAMAPP